MNSKMYPVGSQSVAAADIETTPVSTDLVEVIDATNTNDRKNISLANLFRDFPAMRGLKSQTKTQNFNFAEGDSGVVTCVGTDGVVATLPATVLGMTFILVNTGEDGTVEIKLDPNANDKIMGNGFTSADNKDAINTKATAKKGDFIVVVGDGAAAGGWFIQSIRGIWARE